MEILKKSESKFLEFKIQKSKGFTLLELMVAVSVFAILTLFVVDLYINISRIYLGVLSTRSAQQNIRLAMENILRYSRQAREIEEINDGILYLKYIDDKGNYHYIRFKKFCEDDPYKRRVFSCNGREGKIGVIKVQIEDPPDFSSDFQPLTSQNLNVIAFTVEPTPGIPLILNITLKAQIEEARISEKSLEKGISGTGEIEMRTSVALKGQNYY